MKSFIAAVLLCWLCVTAFADGPKPVPGITSIISSTGLSGSTNGTVVTLSATGGGSGAPLNGTNTWTGPSNTFQGVVYLTNLTVGVTVTPCDIIKLGPLQNIAFQKNGVTVGTMGFTGSGHTEGDGTEMYWGGNRVVINPTYALQLFNSSQSGIHALGFVTYHESATSGSPQRDSQMFGLKYGFYDGSSKVGKMIITSEANGTNGSGSLNFWDSVIDVSAQDEPVTRRMEVISGVGKYTKGQDIYEFAQTTVATNFGVSWESAKYQELDMTGALVLTNIPNSTNYNARPNTVALKILELYPGPASQPVTFPTNWLWTSESGIAVAPTNVPASNMMTVSVRMEIGTSTNFIANYSLASYVPVYDTNAQQFFKAVSDNGGSLTALQSNTINSLVIGGKSDGWWYSNAAIYPLIGGTTNSMCISLKDTNRSWWLPFSGSYITNANGITGDGSTAYILTTFTPSSSSPLMQVDSASVQFYQKVASPVGRFYESGSAGGQMRCGSNSVNQVDIRFMFGGSGFVALSPNFSGYYCQSQLNGIADGAFPGNPPGTTNPVTPSGLPTVPITLLAGQGPTLFSTATLSYVAFGGGKTTAMITAESARVVAFETANGRQ